MARPASAIHGSQARGTRWARAWSCMRRTIVARGKPAVQCEG
jgi:hypothetical protein